MKSVSVFPLIPLLSQTMKHSALRPTNGDEPLQPPFNPHGKGLRGETECGHGDSRADAKSLGALGTSGMKKPATALPGQALC